MKIDFISTVLPTVGALSTSSHYQYPVGILPTGINKIIQLKKYILLSMRGSNL